MLNKLNWQVIVSIEKGTKQEFIAATFKNFK